MKTESEFSTLTVKKLVDAIIPKISTTSRKGDNGTIGVIGGSEEYSGAPYYSAITSLRAGSDLSHIYCHSSAAIPIKSYSPELIVHPSFNQNTDSKTLEKAKRNICCMDSVVVGCGLGREAEIAKVISEFCNSLAESNKVAVILDADSLWYLAKNFDMFSADFKEYKNVILTPNYKEYKRLLKELLHITEEEDNKDMMEFPEGDIVLYENTAFEKIKKNFENEIKLCNKLNNKILLKKGKHDLITNGSTLIVVKNEGSLKRTGGIGDILAGFINSYCGMARKNKKIDQNILMQCCALACYYCRKTAKVAYSKHKFSMTAPDVIDNIREAVANYEI